MSGNFSPAAVVENSAESFIATNCKRRTLASRVECSGIGIHSGEEVNMRILPALESGIVFKRSDVDSEKAYIAARYDNVVDLQRCTRLVNRYDVSVSTVEHICAALAAFSVSDAVIELSGGEVPVMDGSCRDFIAMIERAGVKTLSRRRRVLKILDSVEVNHDSGFCRLRPAAEASFSFALDFSPASLRQEYHFSWRHGDFGRDIGGARTFGFMSEAESLRAGGYALGASCENTLVLDDNGYAVNEDEPRYADEPVRHKILDAIGDLSLAGYPIIGHFHGYKSGHRLNNRLLRALFACSDNYALL